MKRVYGRYDVSSDGTEVESHSVYFYVKCGYKEHADVNAAYNIRDNYLLTLEREAGSSQRAKSDETPVSVTSAAPRGRA